MININTYITEKFKISKNIRNEEEKIKENDIFLFIHIYIQNTLITKKERKINVTYDAEMRCVRSDDKFTFKTTYGHEQSENYIINDKGYIELNGYKNEIGLCFSASSGINVLKDILKNNMSHELLLKYCDSEDTWIKEYAINFNYWEEGLKKSIKKLEEIKN